jgi:nudix-type nucleoside diphosphatase (YffH/AdpP family)
MKYEIIQEEIVYDGFLRIRKAGVVYDAFEGEPISASRETLDSGDAIAVLLLEKDTDSLLLARQFRYPAVAGTSGWVIEIPAGKIEAGDTPLSRAAQEVREELGYAVENLQEIFVFYTSPGTSNERIFLFYGETTRKGQQEKGAGAKDQQEDIQLFRLPVAEIRDFMNGPELCDAKTLIALQWMLRHEHA